MPDEGQVTKTPQTLEPHWELALHAWGSEEENARRLAGKKALIVGVPLAFSAVAAAMRSPATNVLAGVSDGDWPAIVCLLTGGYALLCMLRVLTKALPVRFGIKIREVKLPCSSGLNPVHGKWDGEFPTQRNERPLLSEAVEQDLKAFTLKSDRAARGEAVIRLLLASRKLCGQNERLEKRLQGAIWKAFQGVVFSLITGISYIGVDDLADDAYKEIPGDRLIHAIKGAEE